jgi:hypothetical protein
MVRIIVYLLTAFLMFGCGQTKKEIDPTVIYSACSLDQENSGLCSRFMSRDVYFSNNGDQNGVRNNPFDLLKIQDAMNKMACITALGCNYFIFHYVPESEIKPLTAYTTGYDFKSFIQVWSDAEFSAMSNDIVPNPSEPNAIVIMNPNDKKQFYMIFKSSCFSNSGNGDCTQNNGVSFTSELGLVALISRNFARLINIPLDVSSNCAQTPLDPNTMCGNFPSDYQWSVNEQINFSGLFNNALEAISLNKDYYTQIFLENL